MRNLEASPEKQELRAYAGSWASLSAGFLMLRVSGGLRISLSDRTDCSGEAHLVLCRILSTIILYTPAAAAWPGILFVFYFIGELKKWYEVWHSGSYLKFQ